MGVAIDGGAADIHAHTARSERAAEILLAGERIVDEEILFHSGEKIFLPYEKCFTA
jgi:hypothetical protein